VKVSYRQAARDDVVRQFRYYLVALNLPDIAIRFQDAVRLTVRSLQLHPLVGPQLRSNNRQLRNVRTWPVAGFEAIRIYYLPEGDTLQVIRVLHGKRDLQRILKGEL
jgi:plasmid stabilization system protein ParE